MAHNSKRVVGDLTKLINQFISKGTLKPQNILRNSQEQIKEETQQVHKPVSKSSPQDPPSPIWNKIHSPILTAFEDLTGIKKIKEAHSQLLDTEIKFIESYEVIHEVQKSLTRVQNQLRILRIEIDRIPRGHDHYVDLIRQEAELEDEDRLLRARLEELQKHSEELFFNLSNLLKLNLQKDQKRKENAMYWSILGAFVLILSTTMTLNSRFKEQFVPQQPDTALRINKNEQELARLISPILKDTVAEVLGERRTDALLSQHNARKIIAATKALESTLDRVIVRLASAEETDVDPGVKSPNATTNEEFDKALKTHKPVDRQKWIAIIGLAVLGALSYLS